MVIHEHALDAIMLFNGKDSVYVMDQIDLFSVPFYNTLLSLMILVVVHFLSYVCIDDGTTNDANQMLLNIPCNQLKITTSIPTHCSVTSSYQGHDEEREEEEEEVNEDNIDDNQQRRQEEEEEEGKEDAPSHNCDVGSTNIAVLPSTKKKLKHCYSSSALLPPLIPRSSSTVTTTASTAMLRHHHRSRHDAYRTLQLPVNSTNKLLIITPNGQHQPIITTTTGSENNLQTTGSRLHTTMYDQHNNSNSCFNDETSRTLSRGKLIFLGILFLTLNTFLLSVFK